MTGEHSFTIRWRWLVVLAGIVLLACARAGDFSDVKNLRSAGANIICFGDSLTEGVGAGSGEDYPSVLSRLIPYPVINAGRPGDTVGDGLGRLDAAVLRGNPRLVIILFGGNDFLRQVPLAETKKNLDEMIRRIHEAGAMVAVVAMRLGLFTDEYGPLYREIAREHGAFLISGALQGILSDAKLKSDAIHPNGAGYRLLAERVAAAIKPLLEEADRKRGPLP
ncbi:MAG: arylesterase [Deltaproteobacteria bacterium]|nr:arylesterase [Deltaproteobacteria bacterium]